MAEWMNKWVPEFNPLCALAKIFLSVGETWASVCIGLEVSHNVAIVLIQFTHRLYLIAENHEMHKDLMLNIHKKLIQPVAVELLGKERGHEFLSFIF